MSSTKVNNNNLILIIILIIILLILGQKVVDATKKEPSPDYSLSNVDKQLEHYLSIYAKATNYSWPVITTKQPLKVGVISDNVILLRQRLQLTGDLASSAEQIREFDTNLEKAVLLFQKRHGISATGIVGPETLAALNISPQKRIKQLRNNIQRWRAFESNQGARYLWVNIPDYQARFIENDEVSMKQQVIIGKPSHPTPELFSKITHVMLNPYWVVPPSIAKTNVIPQAIHNPAYLEQQHIHLIQASTQQEIPIRQVDWSLLSNNMKDYFFYQEPGPRNPLGQIKFKITNSQSIYLHDTSSKELFAKNQRALSSGCIRLQDPFLLFSKLAEYHDYTRKQSSQVKHILKSGETMSIKLSEPLPVFITYLTAWVDKNGLLHFEKDIYNRDTV